MASVALRSADDGFKHCGASAQAWAGEPRGKWWNDFATTLAVMSG